VAAVVLSTGGCREKQAPAITIGQLAGMLKSGDPPRLYDANGGSTRKEYGVIPGATLLPSSRDYSLGLLPASKATQLVFCGGGSGRVSEPRGAKAPHKQTMLEARAACFAKS
jgi:hypothetical protein